MKNYIKHIRTQNTPLSREELARICECSPQVINDIEDNEFMPSVELACKIAHALHVSVEDIFQLEGVTSRTRGKKRRKIGLALSGGAARGLAHIGILNVMEKAKLPIDMIVGTSMGALVGATYAMGRNARELEQLAEQWGSKRLSLFADPALPRTGLIRGRKIEDMLTAIIGDIEFKDLQIPFACIATDLESGQEIVINKGPVKKAVRASISIPLILKPVRYEKGYLVDGGLSANVPVATMKTLGMEFVIAVNTTSPAKAEHARQTLQKLSRKSRQPGIMHVMMRMMHIINFQKTLADLQEADVVIQPELGHIGWSDFHRVSECVAQGVLAAQSALPAIQRKLQL